MDTGSVVPSAKTDGAPGEMERDALEVTLEQIDRLPGDFILAPSQTFSPAPRYHLLLSLAKQ